MNKLSETLASLGFGTARSAHNLTLVPLLRPAASPADYLTLDVALAEGLVEVTEISEGGSVPTLKLRNRGERKVLLVDGEELVGARQNRVLNLSVLVPPMAAVTVAFDAGGVCECLRDGVSGHVIRAGDDRAFTAALSRLLADSALRTAQGDAARDFARAAFEPARQARRYLELFSKLLVTKS